MQLIINTQRAQEIIDITDKIKKFVEKSGVKEGLCNIYSVHTTTGIMITENWDPKVRNDVIKVIERLVPTDAGYEHDSEDGNGHAHVKAALIGPSETVPISKGELQLGRWQGIGFGEFDGPRERTIMVSFVENK